MYLSSTIYPLIIIIIYCIVSFINHIPLNYHYGFWFDSFYVRVSTITVVSS